MAARRAASRALTGPFPSAVATMRSAPTCTLTVASVVTPNAPPRWGVESGESVWSVMTRKDSTLK